MKTQTENENKTQQQNHLSVPLLHYNQPIGG